MRARGDFEVKLAALQPYNADPDAQFARMSLDKIFRGDLQAVSKGEMLSAGSPQNGSAGYVAIERVTGTLHGRKGSFSFQHHATMHRGVHQLEVIVVPGSGAGDLRGLSGTLAIVVADGKHSYDFEYELDDDA